MRTFKYPGRFIRVVGNMIAAPWWPISPHFPRHFWDTDTKVQTKLFFLVPFVLLAYWATLRRDKNLLAMMGLCLIFGILFADIVFIGRVYHWGIAFVTFLVCLWMQSYQAAAGSTRPCLALFGICTDGFERDLRDCNGYLFLDPPVFPGESNSRVDSAKSTQGCFAYRCSGL